MAFTTPNSLGALIGWLLFVVGILLAALVLTGVWQAPAGLVILGIALAGLARIT